MRRGGRRAGLVRRLARRAGLSLILAAAPAALHGQDTSPPGPATAPFSLSGYVRALTGIHDAGFDAPGIARRSGFHGQVLRLRWRLELGENVSLSMHNRLQARVASEATGFGDAVGVGVSVVPARPVDLSTHLVEQDRLELWHDIDRLALTVRAGRSDVTLGRQAVTWGLAYLFPVADLWAQFSPFELDTEEKPGIDAVRVLAYPMAGLEIDGVAAARGRAEDWSAGVRATAELASADLYAGAGKFWDQAMLLGGVAYVLEQTTLRAEAVFPWDIDERAWQRPRATLGADWLGARLRLTGEYHHNGIGVTDPEQYLGHFADRRVQRGETYLLARHYLGGALAYTADDDARLHLSLSALWNLNDQSAALTPVLSYDLGQSASLSVGTLQTIGSRITFTPPAPPTIPSEFGAYGNLWFTRLSLFF